jgi:hypothetical protein
VFRMNWVSFKDNQVLLYEVSVTEDPGMYGQHTHKVTDLILPLVNKIYW